MRSKRVRQLQDLARKTNKPIKHIKRAYNLLNKDQREHFIKRMEETK